ncbi:glycosyltransferase [Mycobacterium sp.]|uniref:glycosyltransferase n=1 Tax=Mycobacterium sp. TaxID=1785 RepID=UPI003D0DA79B
MTMPPIRLLQVAGTLDPAYGGPCVVVNQLTRSLNDRGHSVDVVTLDAPSAPWLSALAGPPRGFGSALGKYRYARHLRLWLERFAADYDAVAVHGIWQYQSQAVRAACRRAGVPYFLFVHGALDPWFEKRYPGKHVKKVLYWRLFEHRALRDAQAVIYTCEEERDLARTSFKPYRATEAIVGLGIEEPQGNPALQREEFLTANPHLRDKRILLFLGRLHPKKGCDLLIEAFSRVCHRDESLHLVVAGPDEAATEAGLRMLADSLGVQDRITWVGMLDEGSKWGAYRAAEAFALTSHSENFGIVIAEALACGLPVLITDKVNIWREIERGGAGFVETDTRAGATSLLDRWMNLSDGERTEMRNLAHACFLENFEAKGAAKEFVKSVAGAIGKVNLV